MSFVGFVMRRLIYILCNYCRSIALLAVNFILINSENSCRSYLTGVNAVFWCVFLPKLCQCLFSKTTFQQNRQGGYLVIIKINFSLVLHKNIRCGYSLESHRRGDSNEYPQHLLLWKNMENHF